MSLDIWNRFNIFSKLACVHFKFIWSTLYKWGSKVVRRVNVYLYDFTLDLSFWVWMIETKWFPAALTPSSPAVCTRRDRFLLHSALINVSSTSAIEHVHKDLFIVPTYLTTGDRCIHQLQTCSLEYKLQARAQEVWNLRPYRDTGKQISTLQNRTCQRLSVGNEPLDRTSTV